MPRSGHLTPGKELVPIVQEAVWAPGPVRTRAENLAPTGIQSLDRPARSQSLYQLSYPAHINETNNNIILFVHVSTMKMVFIPVSKHVSMKYADTSGNTTCNSQLFLIKN